MYFWFCRVIFCCHWTESSKKMRNDVAFVAARRHHRSHPMCKQGEQNKTKIAKWWKSSWTWANWRKNLIMCKFPIASSRARLYNVNAYIHSRCVRAGIFMFDASYGCFFSLYSVCVHALRIYKTHYHDVYLYVTGYGCTHTHNINIYQNICFFMSSLWKCK